MWWWRFWTPLRASAFVVAGDGFEHLANGLLQGSPLSGNLFVMVMNWLLEQLDRELAAVGGLLRACADDLRLVGKAFPHLMCIEPVFCGFQAAAGLALHPGKGVVVLMAEAGCDRVLVAAARAVRSGVGWVQSARHTRVLGLRVRTGGRERDVGKGRSGISASHPGDRRQWCAALHVRCAVQLPRVAGAALLAGARLGASAALSRVVAARIGQVVPLPGERAPKRHG